MPKEEKEVEAIRITKEELRQELLKMADKGKIVIPPPEGTIQAIPIPIPCASGICISGSRAMKKASEEPEVRKSIDEIANSIFNELK